MFKIPESYPELLTTAEVAELLRCTQSALQHWRTARQNGDLSAPVYIQHTPRGKVLYPKQQLQEWIDRNYITPQPETMHTQGVNVLSVT